MDYKEKYNKLVEAVKVLQEANPSDEGIQNWVNDNVPELRESENEKIRKELIHLVKKSHEQGGYALHKYEADRMIAWLEKQGTPNQVSIWKHWKDGIAGNGEGKQICLIKSGDSYTLSSCLGYECDYIELSELDKMLSEKQGTSYTKRDIDDAYVEGMAFAKDELEKQKLTWSEEDEGFLNLLLAIFTNEHPNGVFSTDGITVFKGNCVTSNRIITWLKSLRPQNRWKPSDEQIIELRRVISGCSYDIEPLAEMEEQLKKLREE